MKVLFSQSMFDVSSVEVSTGETVIGSFKEDGDKIIASPANGKALPFDNKEQAVHYIILQSLKRPAPPKQVLTATLFSLLLTVLLNSCATTNTNAWLKCIADSEGTDAELCECDKKYHFHLDMESICNK